MEATEAYVIVAALANGMHPLTGETFPEGSPYQHPHVVRALFVATRALEDRSRQLERQRRLPGNAGKPWSEAEDQRLLGAFDAGQSRAEIAGEHARTLGAIDARLEKLGRLAAGESGMRPRGRTFVG